MKKPCIESNTGTIYNRVTTLFRTNLAIYALSGFAPIAKREKITSHKTGTIINRGTTLLSYRPSGRNLNRLKSLSDVTVAPVAPTAISAHRSQNELHWDITDALHQPAFL